MPDVDEVIRVAKSLGMTLGREEAVIYRDRVFAELQALEEFMRMRLEEERPPLLSPQRMPGHRPSAAEDRFNAWYWKCDIRGADHGLLTGKTVSFKDHIAVAGMPLTFGSYLMEGYVSDFDATVVTRVLAAGGTVIGKNSMHGFSGQWGWGLPGDYQRPLNPHAPDHWTGGSSAGGAAAVAAREVNIAFGGDQGGSIRLPAAFCGTYGLKATFGLISHFGIGFGSEQSIDHVGPMTLHAEDLAAALDAVAGYDGYDPRQDRSVPLAISSLGPIAEGVKGLRIGLLEEGFVDVQPDVCDAVMAAVDTLVAAGAKAMKVSVPEHRWVGAAAKPRHLGGSRAIFDVGFFGAFAKTYYPPSLIDATYRLFHEHTDRLLVITKLNLIVSEFARQRYHGMDYAKSQNARASFQRAYDYAFERVDVLVMPTCHFVAPEYIAPETDDVRFEAPTGSKVPRTFNTAPFNFTGHPALSVPCGKSDGLPIGMQLVGRYYEDAVLLRTAYAFEHSVNWERLTDIPAAGARGSVGADRGDGGIE